MSKSEILVWIAGLPEDSPDLPRVDAIRRGADADSGEPLLSLKEVAAVLGYRHYSSLHRLRIQGVGESLGGRLRYRRSRVEAFLKSPECAAIREELREKRRKAEANE